MATATSLIPREVLFGNPERIMPKISPDGRRIAYLAPVENVLNVWIGPADDVESARPVTGDAERGIRTHFWAEDNRHLVYLQDTGGDENWHVHLVDPDAGESRDVTPYPGVQAQLLASSRRHPGSIVVGLNRRDPQIHDAYRLDLATGELELLAENPGFVPWVIDDDLRPRGGIRNLPDGSIELEVDGKVLLSAGLDDALSTGPVTFSRDGSALYILTSVDRNAVELFRIDLRAGELEPVAGDPTYDVSNVDVNPDTLEIEVVSFLRERVDHRPLAPGREADLAAMRAVAGGDLVLGTRDHADRLRIIGFTADDGPIAYHLFDRSDGSARFLFHHQPRLADYTLRSMEPFAFTARDGLEVHGYLTFPADGREQLPTVLFVHGGPWARDVWGYSATAQWLADRGYLCVQVNYRGSTGYGKAFLNAATREWGGRMHDDLIDAVQHVVGAGHADPERIGIYGGSYGGYAALVGATFTPDVFACAVDIVGPSNLKTLIESIPPYWAPLLAQFQRRVGNPDTDADFLWSRSPLSRVSDIRIPMLIAQGANDPRVKMAESDQIVRAMEERGIPHTYMVFQDEGHGFARPENSMRFQAEAERFLAEHLGGRCEP
ncbi:MAG TPA: alpha/beta fold hydrolase [Gaiellales bacterium]|jgi:dipeptidyl aminopeptidase/acylaminoacyl peptidase|nr:alpha/beta fold hydrolase [Gaiellales bacterium]